MFLAGVDLGASNVRVVIANSDGGIEARRESPYAGGAAEAAVRAIGRTVDDLARAVWTGAKVQAIGMALPGTVDPDAGTVASAANLAGWGEVRIADILGAPRGIPVAVENDANAAAIGEGWLGAARGMRDYVFIALGTGIGAGLVLDGRLHRGAHFLAGEVAFFPMDAGQLRAGDWQHNLESIVGGRACAASAGEILGPGASAGDLFAAARDGHAAAGAWLNRVREYLAMAVADIIALLDPQAVVFGGGVALAQAESLIAPVRGLVHRASPVKTPILLSALGKDAQVLGAVRLAMLKAQV